MSLVLTNGKIFTTKLINADLLIEDGKIKAIGQNLTGDETIDITRKTVLPGMIDAHVHFREPGQTNKEDFRSGSTAAAAGGVTTVLDMPNNDPPVISQADLDKKKQLAKKSIVNYGLYIGATPDNLATLNDTDAIAVKVYHGSSTGTLLLNKLSDLAKLVEQTEKLIVVHSENEELIRHFSEKHKHTKQHHLMRDNLAAAVSTAGVVHIAQKYNKHVHIAHMSTKEEVAILRANKANVTCEVAPHHLLLTKEFFQQHGNKGKMNPPLRSEEDRKALWQAINDGIVDMIATDHAPHTREEKHVPFEHGPCGVPGVQTMLPLMLNEVHKGNLELKDVVRLCASNPAKIFNIKQRGNIKEGNYADLVVVDLDREETITDEQQHSKAKWTPFHGKKVRGWPIMTIVNGDIVYKDGEVTVHEGMPIEP